LEEAGSLFRKHEIHHLPVVSPEGLLVGILSQSDFLKLAGHSLANRTAEEIMTTHLAKLEPDDDIRTATSVFALNKFHALPVVENGKIVGMLTTLDLIRFLDKEKVKLADYKV
jgi:CBS domain-containing protein